MEFILIVQRYKDYKDTEFYHHYCQWNGNEERLGNLLRVISLACPWNDYDEDKEKVSVFWGYETRIPESAVDAHMALGSSDYEKHVGTYMIDFEDYTDLELDEIEELDDDDPKREECRDLLNRMYVFLFSDKPKN